MAEEEIRVDETMEPVTETPSAPRKHRRRVRYAAPLGFLVLLFALIGVISVIVGVVQWIAKAGDDTALREELYTFLDPVMQFCPSEFESVETAEDADTLLLSAVYRVSEAERIRQLREKDEECAYPTAEGDKLYRMVVPQSVIEESYRALFGEAPLTNRTIGEVEYHEAQAVYYVPRTFNTSGYTPVLGTLKKSKGAYTVQVAYVSNADIEVDKRGQSIPPTVKMAKYSQSYRVQKVDGQWRLVSVSAYK
jgi:hypothetical protein